MGDVELAVRRAGLLDQQILSNLARKGIRYYVSRGVDHSCEVTLTTLWSKLASAALASNINDKYFSAACNAISVYLNTILKSESEILRQFAISRVVWQQGFECSQYAFACGNTKPALQVLETLTSVLNEHSDDPAASEILQQTGETIAATILINEPHGTIKASCITLSCLLRKTSLFLSLDTVIENSLGRHSAAWQRCRTAHGVARKNGGVPFTSLQEFLLALLFAANNLETRSAALKVFAQICGGEMQIEIPPMTQAARVLEYYVHENQETLGDFANNVLPVLLDSRPSFEAFASLYAPTHDVSTSRLNMYLTVLKIGRMKGYINEEELPTVLDQHLKGCDTKTSIESAAYRSFDRLLHSGTPSVRVHAYNLLTASFATTAPIPAGILDCLNRNFRYLHDDNDAYERGEIISTTRRFLKRLDGSYSNLKKRQQAEKASIDDLQLIHAYEGFIPGFLESISGELEIGISYQRHIIALGNLQLLLDTSFKSWFESCGSYSLTTRLALLVVDAYDDVRATASVILACMRTKYPQSISGLDKQFLAKVLALSAQTCRNDHADAAGRLMALLVPKEPFGLEAPTNQPPHAANNSPTIIQVLKGYLSDVKALGPNTSFPLHAYILALYHTHAVSPISDESAEVLLAICGKIWLLVQPELCIDSPETGTEENDEVNVGGPKDLLAYAWRALRDSSLLLQSMMKSNQQYLKEIGSLCMEELVLLRHRGAFSTVAQTFTMCCDAARASKHAAIRQLLRQWYDIALAQIDVQASKVTRRSAGLPAMFNAILSPQDEPFFREAILTLKHRAAQNLLLEDSLRSEQALPQVHALNCIKDLIANSKFRAVTEQFILEMIQLAADRMSSSTWAIRNCGLMLLRACMNRLDPKMLVSRGSSGAETVAHGPSTVALSLLQEADGSKDACDQYDIQHSERVFAALDLVRHIGTLTDVSDLFNSLIQRHLSSPVWAIRQHAARVLAARLGERNNWLQILQLMPISPESTENETHGLLLFHRCAYRLWEAQAEDGFGESISQSLRQFTNQMTERLQSKLVSPFVVAAVLDIINDALRSMVIRDFYSGEVAQTIRALLVKLPIAHASSQQRLRLSRVLSCIAADRQNDLLLEEVPVGSAALTTVSDSIFVADAFEALAPQLKSCKQQEKLRTFLSTQINDSHTMHPALLTSIAASLETKLETSDGFSVTARARHLQPQFTDGSARKDRDMWNANIRIAALSLRGASVAKESFASLIERGRSWLDEIDIARNDELEFPTRLNAAKAVLNFVSGSSGSNVVTNLINHESIYIQLIVGVYDQLNDDDEELRQMAQSTANKILPCSTSRVLVMPCSLSAREALLNAIQQRYHQSPLLPPLAIARIIGHRDMASRRTRIFERSVETRLASIISAMNDLFAEEKQNLYLDELDEIRKWSQVLANSSMLVIPTPLWQSTVSWTVDGLRALQHTLHTEQTTESGGIGLGLSYNTAVLELSMRVVHLAKAALQVSASVDSDKHPKTEIWRKRIKGGLGAVATVLRDTDAHPLLVHATSSI